MQASAWIFSSVDTRSSSYDDMYSTRNSWIPRHLCSWSCHRSDDLV